MEIEPLLGVVALENVGLVDPVSQALQRLPAVPLKRLRRIDVPPAAPPAALP